ncbi:MAG: hypothetical protein LBI20_01990 [Holosporales bacterium]|nr:hypothetical protein [Holosporales bacterium]
MKIYKAKTESQAGSNPVINAPPQGGAVIDIDMENDYSIRVINPHNPAVSFQVRNPHTTENSFVPITGTSLTHALHGANLSSVIRLIETIPIRQGLHSEQFNKIQGVIANLRTGRPAIVSPTVWELGRRVRISITIDPSLPNSCTTNLECKILKGCITIEAVSCC